MTVEAALRVYVRVASVAGLLNEPPPDVARVVASRRDADIREATLTLGPWSGWPLQRRRAFVRMMMAVRSR